MLYNALFSKCYKIIATYFNVIKFKLFSATFAYTASKLSCTLTDTTHIEIFNFLVAALTHTLD